MRNFKSILHGLKRRYYRYDFNRHCQAVLDTPPVELNDCSELVVLSQSYHKDLLMYLIAAKSFAHYIKPAKFVIVDDGFSFEDKDLIRKHLRCVEFVERKTITSESCPVGGCWERLLTIADICRDHYVIQLDSDTVTVDDPIEVREFIARRASFTLSTKDGRKFISTAEAASAMASNSSPHIQVLAEKVLCEIPEIADRSYIRGCAGFAGFAQNSINRSSVEKISSFMSNMLGANVWARWGSEQFTSNYLIANAPNKDLLPFEKYPYWKLGESSNVARLIHFIGDDRFTSSAYRRVAMKAVAQLRF